jgi:transposase InsO family protein
VELDVARKRVCDILDAPRSTIYAREAAAVRGPSGVVIAFPKRGPRTEISDERLLQLIREVIDESPFSGEGHRKITAYLRRKKKVHVGRKRVLRHVSQRPARSSARQEAPQGQFSRRHDHPESPDLVWGTDATMAWTKNDGWVWALCCVDHFTAEAWTSVAKRGDRFACLEPIYDAVTHRFGRVDADLARGIALRRDWGPQYTSGHFQGAIRWLGIEDSPAFAGEPPCNGCAERFIRTLKEQCLWARLYQDVEDLRRAVLEFTRRYNEQWLIERHGHCTPREAYAAAMESKAA